MLNLDKIVNRKSKKVEEIESLKVRFKTFSSSNDDKNDSEQNLSIFLSHFRNDKDIPAFIFPYTNTQPTTCGANQRATTRYQTIQLCSFFRPNDFCLCEQQCSSYLLNRQKLPKSVIKVAQKQF